MAQEAAAKMKEEVRSVRRTISCHRMSIGRACSDRSVVRCTLESCCISSAAHFNAVACCPLHAICCQLSASRRPPHDDVFWMLWVARARSMHLPWTLAGSIFAAGDPQPTTDTTSDGAAAFLGSADGHAIGDNVIFGRAWTRPCSPEAHTTRNPPIVLALSMGAAALSAGQRCGQRCPQ